MPQLGRRHTPASPYAQANQRRSYIDQALKIFVSRPYYRHEYARTTYKEAQLLQAQGDEADAAKVFQKAFELRQELLPDEKRQIEDLKEIDYDNMVIFWSR